MTTAHIPYEEFRGFARRLDVIVEDVNKEEREMSAEIKGLAAMVRRVKDQINESSDVGGRLGRSAQRLQDSLRQVEDMSNQLDSASAELQAAVGEITNGGDPLEDSGEKSDEPVPLPVEPVPSFLLPSENPAYTPGLAAPAKETASTIAAERIRSGPHKHFSGRPEPDMTVEKSLKLVREAHRQDSQ